MKKQSLSLFNRNITDVTRKTFAKKLLPRMNSLKPKLSDMEKGLASQGCLFFTIRSSIIGPHSPFLFQCVDLKPKFLKKTSTIVERDESYQLITH